MERYYVKLGWSNDRADKNMESYILNTSSMLRRQNPQ